jgi:hypothetical protein
MIIGRDVKRPSHVEIALQFLTWRVGEEETQVSAKHLLRRFDSGTRLTRNS